MGAAQRLDIHGAKGGESKPKSPVEAPDSLQSTNLAKILIAVGEGEFEGTPTARDIFLDNTPIQDASGNYNFTNVKWEWRPGSIEQSYISGIPACSGLMKPDTHLGENARHIEVSDDQATSCLFR